MRGITASYWQTDDGTRNETSLRSTVEILPARLRPSKVVLVKLTRMKNSAVAMNYALEQLILEAEPYAWSASALI